jgi:hypothetical protein
MEIRADDTACKVIHSFSTLIESKTSHLLSTILQQLARAHSTNAPSDATILDLSGLVPKDDPGPQLYLLWVCPISTPSVFSMSCVCEHIRRHIRAGAKMIVTMFNDLGGESVEVTAGPGTYLIGLKKMDEKHRCVPVNFSSREKAALKHQRDCTDSSCGQDIEDKK